MMDQIFKQDKDTKSVIGKTATLELTPAQAQSVAAAQNLGTISLSLRPLADRLGIDHAWEVEHHFLEEYSHSSAPEVFLAACSQRTKNIRLGHGVIVSTDLQKALAWYREMLGFIPSDEIFRDDEHNVISSFNRIDRGDTYVDHHVFFCMQGATAGLNHLAFEVANFDAVMLGHEHMKSVGKYRPIWGVGRHIYGSQIFDYWADPWGRVHEHMTDSDRLNASAEPHLNRAARPAPFGVISTSSRSAGSWPSSRSGHSITAAPSSRASSRPIS